MRESNNRGFTLLELLAVLIILSLLLTLITPRVLATISNAREAVCIENRRTIKRTYHTYYSEHLIYNLDNPITLENLINANEVPNNFPLNMNKKFCPSGGTIVYQDGELLCTFHDNAHISLISIPNVISENVFVYGTSLVFSGSNISGSNATIIIDGNLNTADLNLGTQIDISNIFITGSVSLLSGSTGLGSESSPGEIHVSSDVTFGTGERNIYGDMFINGDFHIGQSWIHGNVYVNGNFMIYYDSIYRDIGNFISGTAGHVYYSGDLLTDLDLKSQQLISEKATKVDEVELAVLPKVKVPSLREEAWYDANNYQDNGPLASGSRIFTSEFYETSPNGPLDNIVIVATEGDISITGAWSGTITGILVAPNGKVTFGGSAFEGLIIAKEGLEVITGGTNIVFRSALDFLSEDQLPFIP